MLPTQENNEFQGHFQSQPGQGGATGTVRSKFRCHKPGCRRHYARKSDLRRHEREEHHNDPLKCPVDGCGQEFKRQYRLVKHLMNPGDFMHPKVPNKTLADILIYGSNKASQGEIVFDKEGRHIVSTEKIENSDMIQSGRYKIQKGFLKCFVHFTCPMKGCQGSDSTLFFCRAQRHGLLGRFGCHLMDIHNMTVQVAQRLAEETGANALACARLEAEQE